MFVNNSLGPPEKRWENFPILIKIVNYCLDRSKMYDVPSHYIITGLVKGKQSLHFPMVRNIDEIKRLFEKFDKPIIIFEQTGDVPNMQDNMSTQLVATHRLSAPQLAVLLFYHSGWADIEPTIVESHISKVFLAVTKELKSLPKNF